MGPFDDELRRKLLFDENIRRSLAIDDATRRALADSVDIGRRAREMAEQHALMTDASRMGELFDQTQLQQALAQYRLSISENSNFRTAVESLRNVETLRTVMGSSMELRQAAERMALTITPQLRDQITGAAERYRNNFTLPDVSNITKFAQQAFAASDFHLSVSNAAKAMEAMRSPWLDSRRVLESVQGFANIQAIGAGASQIPFDATFTTTLRRHLGDWRDVKTFPSLILDNPVARSDFYVARGFDSALADFPEEAFDEATEVAGLIFDQEYEFDFSGHERIYAQVVRVEYELRQFVHRVMTEEFGENWTDRVSDLSKRWKQTKEKRLAERQPEQPLLISYSELSDLLLIMERRDHFHLFKPAFRRLESMQETFRRILPARHAVSHCGIVTQIDVITVLAESVRLRHAIRS